MVGHWEINGNLEGETGIPNYALFEKAIVRVKAFFDAAFGVELLNRIDFYVD